MRALALSPHLDDAVFSAGGTLARLADAGWAVTIATVFTRSVPDPRGFALACQLDKGLDASVDYMALRREEDRRACAVLGAEPVFLPLEEAPHRGYGSAPALFGAVRDDDAAAAAIEAVVADAIGRVRPDLLLAPQAIGGHVDHVLTVRALRALGRREPVLWWRDFPYVARGADAAAPFGAEFEALGERAAAIDEARKGAACACYGSQIGFQFGGAAGLARLIGDAGGRERFRVEGVWPAVLDGRVAA